MGFLLKTVVDALSFKLQGLSWVPARFNEVVWCCLPAGSTHHLGHVLEAARDLSVPDFRVFNDKPGLERTTLRNTSLPPPVSAASLESKVSANFYRHISTGVTMWSDSSEPRRSQTSKRVCKTFGSEVRPSLAERDTAS